MPKRVKRRRVHRGSMSGKANKGNTVTYGDFGLVAMEPSWITSNQIEAARVAMTRYMKRGGKVWIKIFPHKPITRKPAETRMGAGKGSPEYWVAVVKPGRVMFEIGGVGEEKAREAMRLAANKLPCLLYTSAPERDVDKDFLMPVEDVFSITGRGTVATGRVERGVLKVQDEVELVGLAEAPRKVVVTGVEMFRKLLDQAEAGDNIGALLRGVQRNEIERGQVLAKPGTVNAHTKFTAEIYVLKKEEGGRHTPFFDGYRPQFYFRTTDVTGACKLPEGTEMVMPGDNVTIEVDLINSICVEEGLRFAIREGGRTVASGVVASIIE